MTEKESDYAYKKKSAWEQFSDGQHQEAYAFSEGYKAFLQQVKTEREAIQFIQTKAEETQHKCLINRGKKQLSLSKEKNQSPKVYTLS